MLTKSNNTIMQFRVIDIDGKEVVRVERKNIGSEVMSTNESLLQDKGDRYYFTESMKLAEREVSISNIDLNVEFGVIEHPIKPTLRFATPFFLNGLKSGIVIINFFANDILQHFKSLKHIDIYLANKTGSYISHPDGKLNFTKDYNVKSNIFNDFPFMSKVKDSGFYFDKKKLMAKKIVLSKSSCFYVIYNIQKAYLSRIHKEQIILSLLLYLLSGIYAFFMSVLLSKYPSDKYEKRINEIESMKTYASKMKSKMVELHDSSYLDPLTSVFNRRYFDEKLMSYFESNEIFSMILIDIDHFKKVNDTYGHDEGDRVLIELTQLLSANIRETDFLARWGGEEFSIVLKNSDKKSVVDIADKLRKITEQYDFGFKKNITCSFGIAIREEGEEIDPVFKRADNALYEAKKQGRNRVVIR
ncbi:MAG: hypothetical protein C0603_01615 [Denitrovibrio sp.]|nr:MAG: hypothetical protein C0603_01615 [Denitrovibrio sp.]